MARTTCPYCGKSFEPVASRKKKPRKAAGNGSPDTSSEASLRQKFEKVKHLIE